MSEPLFLRQSRGLTLAEIADLTGATPVLPAPHSRRIVNIAPLDRAAPSDLAFRKLDKSVLENLLKPESITKLKNLINSHIVSGKINYKDLKDDEKLKTVNGGELHVHVKDGKVYIEEALVQSRDVQTSNGIIHSLDTVMMKN